MMQFKRKYFLFLLPLLLFVQATVSSSEMLRVGVYQNPPLSFVDEDGDAQGFVVDLLKEVAEKEDWDLEFISCEWDECLLALEAGEIDLLGPIAYSEERSKRFDFSEETLITNWGQVYVQSGETNVSILDLDGKTIAGISGDIHTEHLQNRLSHFGFVADFIFVDNYALVMQRVEDGRAFGGVVNYLYALQYAADYDVTQSAIIFNPIEIRFAATKGEHIDLLSALDKQIAAMKADKISTYYQRLNIWFDAPVESGMPLWAKWVAGFLFILIFALGLGSIFLRSAISKRTVALEESDRKYRHLVNNSLVGIYITQNHIIQFANQGMADLFGYPSAKDILGVHAQKLVTSQSWEKVNEEVQLRESGKKKNSRYQFQGLRKDGRVIDIEALGGIIDYQGQVALQGVLIDITEQIQAEERFKGLSEASFEAIFISEKGVFLEQNLAAEKLFGYTLEETVDMPATNYFLLEDRDRVIANMLSGYEKPYRATALHKDGSTFSAEIQARMMHYKERTVRVTSIRDISVQVQAAKDLEESEERYRNLFENMPIGVYRSTPEGQLLDVNLTFIQMLGYPDKETLLVVNVAELFEHPKERKLELSGLGKKDIVKKFEMQIRQYDGDLIWVQDTFRALRDSDGKILYFEGSLENITERKETERALRESEKKFRDLFEKSEDALLIIENGKFIDCNQATVQMLRYKDKNKFLNTHPSALSPEKQPDGRNSLEKANEMIRIAIEKSSHRFIWDHQRADGEVFPVEVLLTAITINEEHQILHATWRDITERVQAEKKLLRTKEQFEKVVAQAPVPMVITDAKGDIEYYNDKFIEIFGYTLNDLSKAEKWWEITYPDADYRLQVQKSWEKAIAKANETGAEIETQVWDMTCKDGSVCTVEFDMMPLGDISIIAMNDITERVNSEKALRESEKQLKAVLEGSQAGFWDWNIETDAVHRNERWATMLGYTLKEIELNLTQWADLHHPDDTDTVLRAVQDHLDGKTASYEIEYRMLSKGGNYIWVQDRARITARNAQGKPIRMSGTQIDITERKQAEKALRKSKELLEQERKIFVGGAVATFKWQNKEGWPVEYVSPNVHTILGYRAEEFISGEISYAKIIPSEDIERVAREVAEGGESSTERFVHEPYRIIKKDGEIIWIADYTTILRNETGEITHYLGYIVDITERIKSEKALRESEAFLLQSQKVAQLGSYDMNLKTGKWISSATLNTIFGIDGEYPYDTKGWLEIIHPDDLEMLKNYFEDDVLTQHKRFDRKYRILRVNDQEMRWVSSLGEVHHDDQGVPIKIIGTIQDVTTQVEAEKVLKETTSFLQQSQEVARLGSYDLDTITGQWVGSSVLNTIFGIDEKYPHNLDGWLEIVHPDDWEMMRKYFADDVLSQHQRFEKEYRIKRVNDKETRWVYGLGELERDSQGNSIRMIGTIQDITKQVKAKDVLKNYTQELETRNTITTALSTSLQLEDLLEVILVEVTRVINFDSASIFFMEDDGLVTIAKAVGDAAQFTGFSTPLEKTLMQDINAEGQALILDDATNAPSFQQWDRMHTIIRGWMGIPLYARDTLVGYLTFDSRQSRAFSPQDAALAESFAPHIAQALYNARLHKSTQQQSKDLASLLRASQALATTLNRDELLQKAVEEVVNIAQVESGAIYLLEEETLYLGATTPPLPLEFPKALRYAPLADHPHIQKALDENSPIFLPDTAKAELSPVEKIVCETRGLRSIFYLPFISREEVRGIIILGTVGDIWVLSETETDLYQTLSNQVGMAVENAHLYGQVIQDSNEMEKRIQERTEELQNFVNLTAGREIRMVGLKEIIKKLRTQLVEAGQVPVADDPLIPNQ